VAVDDGHVWYRNQTVLRLLRSSGRALAVHWYGGDVLSIQLDLHTAAPDE
jgi:hypothetical protein